MITLKFFHKEMMKKSLFCLFLFMTGILVSAQNATNEEYTFTVIKEVKATPVKNQARSSTCWAYSGLSFLESEMLRKGKPRR